MAITTVVDFWQQEVDVYTTEKTAAQADLTAAQTGVATAKQQRDADVAALAANRTGIAAKRAKLANSKIPTETEALTTEIRDLIEQQRLLQGTILDDQDQLDWWQASLDVASAGVERVSARLSDATTQLKQAKDDRKARSDLTTALAQAPFANLKGDATTFLGGGVVTDATTQLQGTDFPSP